MTIIYICLKSCVWSGSIKISDDLDSGKSMWQQMEELSIEEELDRHFSKKKLPIVIDDDSLKAWSLNPKYRMSQVGYFLHRMQIVLRGIQI
jgi:hypothetical protein